MDSDKVTPTDGSSVKAEQESGLICRIWSQMIALLLKLKSAASRPAKRILRIGADDTRKTIHCIKVGLALTLVSIFYYARPLYDGVGGTSMWAIMTVVVVFEFTVGGSLSKGFNRAIATISGGALAFSIHWLASQCGQTAELIIVGTTVILLTIVATFLRFVPTIKAKFEYGLRVFVLTFNLVATSGYRVHNLLEMAQHRALTIAIGVSITLTVCIVVFPVWAGDDLHELIIRNMGKLADSLEESVVDYFEEKNDDARKSSSQNSLSYKCVLNSMSSEDSLAKLAGWEPSHGRFGLKHPWSQYLKIGITMRYCAYSLEVLNGKINSDIQAPGLIKKHLSDVCIKLSLECSKVLKESANSIKTMKKRSSTIEFLVGEMNYAVEDVHNSLRTLPAAIIGDYTSDQEKKNLISTAEVPLMETLPLTSVASLLIEISTRIERIVDAVEDLAELADFTITDDEKLEEIKPINILTSSSGPQAHEAIHQV